MRYRFLFRWKVEGNGKKRVEMNEEKGSSLTADSTYFEIIQRLCPY